MSLSRVAIAVVGVLVLAGCASTSGDQDSASVFPSPSASLPNPPPAPTAGPLPDDPALRPFYEQQLRWEKCGGQFDCASLRVPLDYRSPGDGDVSVAVVRRNAEDPARRQGSLVVEPGGPGGSGVEFVRAGRATINPAARAAFDVIGFDPRGVGESEPIECLNDAQLDEWLSTDAPDLTAEAIATSPQPSASADPGYDDGEDQISISRAFGNTCAARTPRIVPYMSTVDVARDLDILRAALGEDRLNYLGYSYGTLIGAEYAEYFPSRVGRFVLDGAMDPEQTQVESNRLQAIGFERALDRFVQYCVADSGCPLGTAAQPAKERLQQFLDAIDAEPLRTDDSVRPLTQGLAVSALAGSMYRPDSGWPALQTALQEALAGNGQMMLEIADAFNDRSPDGEYRGNSASAIYGVQCLDATDRVDVARSAELAAQWSADAPVFGAYLAWNMLPCNYWPTASTGGPHTVSAAGSAPILVVGNEFDPATPYEQAVSLANQLDNAVLLTWASGDGHLAYNRGDACIDAAINQALVEGKAPAADLTCVAR